MRACPGRARRARTGRHESAPSGRVPTTATRAKAGANRRLGSTVSCRPERGSADPSPPRRPSGHARLSDDDGPPRPAATQSGCSYRRLAGGGWSSSTGSRRPVEPGATTSSACSTTSPSLAATPSGHAECRAVGCAVVSNGVSNGIGIPDDQAEVGGNHNPRVGGSSPSSGIVESPGNRNILMLEASQVDTGFLWQM